MDALKKRRTNLKAALTKFSNYFKDNKADRCNIMQIKIRLEKIDGILIDYLSIQDQLDLLPETEVEQDQLKTDEFENTYYQTLADVRQYLESSTPISIPSGSNIGSTGTPQSDAFVKLPTIDLPSFNGHFDSWVEFHDTFKALIHDNNRIADIQKFLYLKTSLKGEVSSILKEIDVSAANYSVAWSILVERYHNESLMVNNHIKHLLRLPKLVVESHEGLKSFMDNSSKHLGSLKKLGEPVDDWGTLLIHILLDKLDGVTRRVWEEANRATKTKPIVKTLLDFLKSRCDILEALWEPSSKFNKRFSSSHTSSLENVDKSSTCKCCKRPNHSIFECRKFLALPVYKRLSTAKNLGICYNCLSAKHSAHACPSGSCLKCQKKHNTLLHIDQGQERNNGTATYIAPAVRSLTSKGGSADNLDRPTENAPIANASTTAHSGSEQHEQVLLSTAVVLAGRIQGDAVTCRVLLDSGSMSNFVSEPFLEKLGVKKQRINMLIHGVNDTKSSIKYSAAVHIRSIDNAYNTRLNCLVVPRVTGHLPTYSFSRSTLNIPVGFKLADPNFSISQEVDMLIGAHCFYEVLLSQQEILGKGLPVLQNTLFGWVVGGNMLSSGPVTVPRNYHCVTECSSLSEQLKQFWEIENCEHNDVLSLEDKICEEQFINSLSRAPDGKFVVAIPFKDSLSQLGESRNTALKRFYKMETKLCKNPQLQKDYISFMREYHELGHMRKLDHDTHDKLCYYLPHHPVVNEFSTTTKVRIVFDGSAKTSTGVSLNDTQMIGPKLQSDIFSILLRFRKHPFVISADISKMYRQIWIQDSQQCLQRIFWRDNPYEKLSCFELKTVTYGTGSAPYLAIRCLKQLALECRHTHPLESRIIDKDFYVDDLLTGASSLDAINIIRDNITMILASAGFILRKWASNYGNKNSVDSIQVGKVDADTRKTLGIWWDVNKDIFQYKVTASLEPEIVTKRSILSSISKLYDPLGLVGPVILTGKLIIQKLWKDSFGWDEQVPNQILINWKLFINELVFVEEIKLPRFIIEPSSCEIEVHGFCDASESAYGACIYLKSVNNTGRSQVSLVCAKSKVSPLKTMTLPRLELEGAVLLAKLMKRTISSLEITYNQIYYWTDSTIALCWIKADPSLRKSFVANRVATIQELTESTRWFHVRTHDNPADLISRGVTGSKLVNCNIWWSGPDWLSLDNSTWPVTTDFVEKTDLPESRAVHTVLETLDIFSRYSKLSKLIRVTALCMRFIGNCKPTTDNRIIGLLTVIELNNARAQLIRSIQSVFFAEELKYLEKTKGVKRSSSIIKLRPFIDNDKLIRVGGRLNNSHFEYDKKHPILLPQKHDFTILVFRDYHESLLHCGPQALWAAVREVYWPVAGRATAKFVVGRCVTCFKASPKTFMPIMGALPKGRVTPAPPFSTCGVDYAGPFLINDKRSRGAKKIKSYICIFVCFATKAVHLELVSELTTDCFLAALNRFVARRGRPHEIHSDNGTNFVGAAAELGRFLKIQNANDGLINGLADRGISWKFIPPNSPHFGGLWEAGVKSTKGHLFRVLRNASIVYEEFYTLLTQIEAVLNSRPISPLSSDPTDYTPLTPAHFLIGRALTDVPSPDYTAIQENRLARYERIQQLMQHFWVRWSKEYVGELQHRSKWATSSHQLLQSGAMVLIREENTPPRQWRVGRVLESHVGKDNIVRVATIRTARGDIKRAVARLCVLPIDYLGE